MCLHKWQVSKVKLEVRVMKSICWLIVFLVLLVLEIISLGLTTIWFALGALVAFIATLAGAGYVIQFIVFIAVSFVTLVLTRPLAVKYFNTNLTKTNVEALSGKTVIITKSITEDNPFGEASLDGETWMACSEDGTSMKEGEKAEVVRVEGVKLILKKL